MLQTFSRTDTNIRRQSKEVVVVNICVNHHFEEKSKGMPPLVLSLMPHQVVFLSQLCVHHMHGLGRREGCFVYF
jgi:hypothetical protein